MGWGVGIEVTVSLFRLENGGTFQKLMLCRILHIILWQTGKLRGYKSIECSPAPPWSETLRGVPAAMQQRIFLKKRGVCILLLTDGNRQIVSLYIDCTHHMSVQWVELRCPLPQYAHEEHLADRCYFERCLSSIREFVLWLPADQSQLQHGKYVFRVCVLCFV